MEIIAQFRIEKEALLNNETGNNEVKSAITARLRNRSAIFDRLIEAGFNENVEQLSDENDESDPIQAEEVNLKTLIDVALSVDDQTLRALEQDEDLVYVKALSEINSDALQMETVQQSYDTSLIIFRRK